MDFLDGNETEILLDYPYYDNDTLATGIEPFEALSKPLQAFLICLYTVTAFLALSGNVTAIWVLMFGKRSSRELRIFLGK